jgi:hypothetical protein
LRLQARFRHSGAVRKLARDLHAEGQRFLR